MRHTRFAALLLVLLFVMFAAAPVVSASGCGSVVIEAATGRILYADNADARLPMASTTKIMTALLALEAPDPDAPFAVGREVLVEGSAMGLAPGDLVTLRVLAAGMLLESGNDAANAAAVHIAGSPEAFAARMNERARDLGLAGTHFETPSGLDGDAHYSTPADMARLAAAALRNPDFAALCRQSSMTVTFGSPETTVTLYNHNRLLTSYEGAIGVKTGFTKKAGRCLVSAAVRDGVTLICATLGVYDDWHVHAALLDRAFASLVRVVPDVPLPQDIAVAGTGARVPLVPAAVPALSLVPGETPRVRLRLPPFLYAPVHPGQVVGSADFLLGDAVIGSAQILVGGL